MMLSSSSSSSTTISALLAASVGLPLLAAAAELTTDDLLAKISPTAALPGFNVEGGSVFTNLANALNHEQFFFIYTLQHLLMKNPNRILFVAVVLLGAAISPSRMSTTPPSWVMLAVVLRCSWPDMTLRSQQELRCYLITQKESVAFIHGHICSLCGTAKRFRRSISRRC